MHAGEELDGGRVLLCIVVLWIWSFRDFVRIALGLGLYFAVARGIALEHSTDAARSFGFMAPWGLRLGPRRHKAKAGVVRQWRATPGAELRPARRRERGGWKGLWRGC